MVWRFDPSIVEGIGLLTAAYIIGAVVPRRVSLTQAVLFLAGLVVLFLALESPLDTLGDTALLSAHMTQHLLMVLVIPPLVLAGTPGWALRPLVAVPAIRFIARRITRGSMAFAVYNVVFALAHLPIFFDLTLRNEGVHIAEHVVFLATGLLAWWPILSPLPEAPRLPYPYQMLYLFLQTLPCSLVGALITLSGVVLYAPYTNASRAFGLSALNDQQIAGLAMWIGGSVYYFLAFMIVFFVWAAHEEPHKPKLTLLAGSSR